MMPGRTPGRALFPAPARVDRRPLSEGRKALRAYECLYILHPASDANEQTRSSEKYSDLIKGMGGEVHKVDIWGKRKLAYPIEEHGDGCFVLLRFQAKPESIQDMEFRMRVDDRVLRYVTCYEVPEGAGQSDELMQLTERKERERRGRGRGRGRGRSYDSPRHSDDRRDERREPRAAAGDRDKPAAAEAPKPAPAESAPRNDTPEGGAQ
jgi:small subunit ribosomal protein S6